LRTEPGDGEPTSTAEIDGMPVEIWIRRV
jgi:hypothetical protein